LKNPVAKIIAIHTRGCEAKKVNFNMVKGLEAELVLAKRSRVMLTANIWTESELVNEVMKIV